MDNNEKINWFPQHLKYGRFKKGLETAPDWNISRSRYWGTPMPIWIGGNAAGKKLMRVLGSVADLKEWAVDREKADKVTDIHRQYLDDLEVWVDDERMVKGSRIPEVFDCWVESGSMPFASIHYPFENQSFFAANYPADFVSEYIAQTRAWFYTMHVLSVGIFGEPPFRNVLTTGTILAEDGTKMSKSKNNYPDPMLLVNKYGVDSLRLYLMSSTLLKGENLNFSEKEVADLRRKVFVIWWNVFSFYQTFADRSLDFAAVPQPPAAVLDKWLLARLTDLIDGVTTHMNNYDLVRSSRLLVDFIADLSNWYLRLSRDRLKTNPESGQVLGHTLYTLAQLFAPFTPFFSETLHHTLVDENTSIHHTDWPQAANYQSLTQSELVAQMAIVQKVTELGHALRRERAVKVRQPLATLTVTGPALSDFETLKSILLAELNVKKVEWQVAESDLKVEFDFNLTPELQAEGQAREIMRSIQGLRKAAGLNVDEVVTVTCPTWPTEWQQTIETKTKTRLEKGETLQLR